MLNKEDLKQIRNVVQDIVIPSENRIKLELREELASKKDIELVKNELKSEMVTKKEFRKENRKTWEELREIRSALNGAIRLFDEEISRIKTHLSLQ